MEMPAPSLSYDASISPVKAQGLFYDKEQANALLSGPVKEVLRDVVGMNQMQDLLDGVASTGFEQGLLSEVLTNNIAPTNDRIGEVLAEVFVTQSGLCTFPWPTGRDLKNPKASPAGCDLTGFQSVDDDDCPFRFVFGEVKTSGELRSPPSVMNSLSDQLHSLKDNRQTKDALFRYLGHHARGADWESAYKSAAKRYLRSNTTDIAIYGVLVRDVTPKKTDISNCASKLAMSCPKHTTVELYALYLPVRTIGLLSDRFESIQPEAL